MFVLVAVDRVETSTVVVDLVDDTKLTLELWRDLDIAVDLPTFQSALQLSFDTFIPQVGPYAHGDRFVGYAWNDPGRSMEYDGATTTILEAADHELFHSWWGRSIKPATQNDGWIDEAWDMHPVTIGFNETPIDFMDDPVTLCSQNPWVRITPDAAYDTGERVFAGIAAMVGTAELQLVMRTFYRCRAAVLPPCWHRCRCPPCRPVPAPSLSATAYRCRAAVLPPCWHRCRCPPLPAVPAPPLPVPAPSLPARRAGMSAPLPPLAAVPARWYRRVGTAAAHPPCRCCPASPCRRWRRWPAHRCRPLCRHRRAAPAVGAPAAPLLASPPSCRRARSRHRSP